MKKISFLLAMLASVAASATVTVTPISTNYTVPPTVTFKVEWTNTPTAPYNSRVWVWVDFCSITGTTPGTFTNAEISGATSSGNILSVPGNTRGFYVITNPSTVTATLSNASGKFNWCAYGSDYPPNVLANTNGSYTLAGTPPFKLIASNGTTAQTVTETIIATSAITITPATITDATGYPGLWCPYTGSDLYMDATHRCMERQSGAGNWEAWIKDTRDNELYRIVKMPDDNWWLAQNVRYKGTGIGNPYNGCTDALCGRLYTGAQMSSTYTGSIGTSGYGANKQGVCPNNWTLPVFATWRAFVDAIETVSNWYYYNNVDGFTFIYGCSNTISLKLASEKNGTVSGNNHYGWNIDGLASKINNGYENWRGNDKKNNDLGLLIAYQLNIKRADCVDIVSSTSTRDDAAPVRCFRQL